jgi:WhiB family transcriptional regulator, redox-sensing transcriptional regulator
MGDWRHSAACRWTDAELHFPIGTTGSSVPQIEAAKSVCGACPVVSECREYALDNGITDGIWGGLTEGERRAVARRRSRARGREGAPRAARRDDYVDAAESRRLIEEAMRADGELSIRELRRRTGISHETLSAILDGERGGEPTRVLPGTEQRLRFALAAVTA